MEAPGDSDSEDISDEPICILPEDLEDDEVDINIHFHCEHCIKLSKCNERSKPGWSCDIISCPLLCGIKFHACKFDEHELLCPNAQVPCINAGNGCPHFLQQKQMSWHLPVCPASVVVCNAEWNRWALGARERERISISKGTTALYDSSDLDMAMTLHDQKLVNDLHLYPKEIRKILCNGITRRFPSLPLTLHGSYREDTVLPTRKDRARSQSTTDDDEEGLTPGLSLSVCTELLKGMNIIHENKHCQCEEVNCHDDGSSIVTFCEPSSKLLERNKLILNQKGAADDDISAKCCSHGILKDLCNFCRGDPDEPDYKIGKVWRQRVALKSPGETQWVLESRVEKIRKRGPMGMFSFKRVESEEEEEECLEGGTTPKKVSPHGRFSTPPPVALTSADLSLEMALKRYSRHQVKARAMFTFLCMQEVRRDQYASHYKNVHSEIQEGLDGWLISRCPLHIIGCPFSFDKFNPGPYPADVVFSDTLHSFGIRPICSSTSDTEKDKPTQTPSTPKGTRPQNVALQSDGTEAQITLLPVEVLQYIASFLDGFSINNLSMTCRLLRDVCYSLLNDKGLVIQEWVRSVTDNKISWKIGTNRWFFPKNFEYVSQWGFKEGRCMSNHLSQCPFNNRHISKDKFCYIPLNQEELQKLTLKQK